MQASAAEASVKYLKGCKTLNKDPDPKNPVEGKEERSVSSVIRQLRKIIMLVISFSCIIFIDPGMLSHFLDLSIASTSMLRANCT